MWPQWLISQPLGYLPLIKPGSDREAGAAQGDVVLVAGGGNLVGGNRSARLGDAGDAVSVWLIDLSRIGRCAQAGIAFSFREQFP